MLVYISQNWSDSSIVDSKLKNKFHWTLMIDWWFNTEAWWPIALLNLICDSQQIGRWLQQKWIRKLSYWSSLWCYLDQTSSDAVIAHLLFLQGHSLERLRCHVQLLLKISCVELDSNMYFWTCSWIQNEWTDLICWLQRSAERVTSLLKCEIKDEKWLLHFFLVHIHLVHQWQ